jgi:hypothetical protein
MEDKQPISEKLELLYSIVNHYAEGVVKAVSLAQWSLSKEDIDSIPIISMPKSEKETLDKYAIIFSVLYDKETEEIVCLYSCGGAPFRIQILP